MIDLMPDQQGVEMGGTMRLGLGRACSNQARKRGQPTRSRSFPSAIGIDSRSTTSSGRPSTRRDLSPVGRRQTVNSVEIMELKDHPFYLGVQFHPEFRSRPNRPHPLFRDFVAAAHLERLPEGAQRELPIDDTIETPVYRPLAHAITAD